MIATDRKKATHHLPLSLHAVPAGETDISEGAPPSDSSRQPPVCASEQLAATKAQKKATNKHKTNQHSEATQNSRKEVQHQQLPNLLDTGPRHSEGNHSALPAASATMARANGKTKNKFKQSGQARAQIDAALQLREDPPVAPSASSQLRGEKTGPRATREQQSDKRADFSLLGKMRSKLQGGHFRWLNEQMYTQPGKQAYQLMHEDPSMFEEYHEVCPSLRDKSHVVNA